ncbi:MAG: RluA family pseudouridine synthase [Symbiobacteriaceae bacterium]|nr:RluA family pseudouridine synthase [Symbiobacteriaceae bacterium]
MHSGIDSSEENYNPEEEKVFTYQVTENVERLDLWLSVQSGLSRSQVQRLIKDGYVWLDGVIKPASSSLQVGQIVEMKEPAVESLMLTPEAIPLDIIYEDSSLIMVNKQRNMVVHPSPGHLTGTLVHALLYHCKDLGSIGGTIRPGIVHRLDKDTTGMLVVAKDEATMEALSTQIRERRMERHYLALVWGGPNEDEGSIDLPIGRHPRDRQKMAVVATGRNAVTSYRVLIRDVGFSLLHIKLDTGRTHQIRVHMSHCGYPVVGDPLYQPRRNPFGLSAQALHAWKLCIDHPVTRERLCKEGALPDDFTEALHRLRFTYSLKKEN